MNFNDIATRFYTAGANYSAAIQPYAVKLFVALLLIDILVTWIQFIAEGQLDASHFLGRLIKHILSGGFVYLMIVNAFSWMNAVLKSFSAIGASVTGLPALNPQSVLKIGINTANIIFNSPGNASMMTNFEQAIVQSIAAFIVLLAFVVTAAMLLLTLIESYLVVGGGVILLGLGANRFTAPAAEGYFGYVIRVGVRLLFFYLVLAIGVQMANEWSAALVAACKPVPATLPWWTTYGLPPSVDRHDRLLWNDSRLRHAQLCSSINRLYDRQHRRASHGGQYRRRNDWPRAQPRLRSSLRCPDDHSTDHKRASDRIQQGRSDRQR